MALFAPAALAYDLATAVLIAAACRPSGARLSLCTLEHELSVLRAQRAAVETE